MQAEQCAQCGAQLVPATAPRDGKSPGRIALTVKSPPPPIVRGDYHDRERD